MMVDIISTYAVPFVRDVLDTPDTMYISAKLIYMVTGITIFVVLTVLSCRISEKRFCELDLN